MRRPHPGTQRRGRMVPVAFVVFVVLHHVAPVPPAAAQAPPYTPPVDAPVLDPFRALPNPYAAGNRGLDYATPPGAPVRASGPGEVTFAGPVGQGRHVVVLHPDGLRTSYSFLATVAVRRGQVVAQGDVVGTSGVAVHFGVRAGERYVDPALLLAGRPVGAHLVPVDARVAQSPAQERGWLVDALDRSGRLGRAVGDAADWLVDRAVETVEARVPRRIRVAVLLGEAALDIGRSYLELREDQEGCTPAGAAPPPPPEGPKRRIVVLVGGYGSAGGAADVLDLDTDALGYHPDDRVQFSYAGGRVPGVGALTGVGVSDYDAATSMEDLAQSGERLRALLTEIDTAHPGVAVDVVAHSQGGLVARAALADGPDDLPVEHLVTLGSPHRGAALATVAADLGAGDDGSLVGAAVAELTGGAVDPRAPAVAQMEAGSAFFVDLDRRPLDPDVTFTSVAAAGDVVVPAPSSVAEGATNTLVSVGGVTDHGSLPGSPEAAREVALALRGLGPSCAAPLTHLGGLTAGAAVGVGQRAVGGEVGTWVRPADDLAGLVVGAAQETRGWGG